ncbi:hypothetical protein [Providencia phage PSTRCR_120]|uniref:Uncharacterized protein n=1 Tax=Providencia phage PSTRCR_120 TaxID=2800826 RepID=A0A7T6ZLW8_9CAUD|nr:hypothetical protein [Providencia phage PSTRCR_120]
MVGNSMDCNNHVYQFIHEWWENSMVNYGKLNDLCQKIRSLGFKITIHTDECPYGMEFYVGFTIRGICSYGCWRIDEQVAVNRVAEKLSYIYSDLCYWTIKSK